MHIGGMGDEAQLATAVGKVFANQRDERRQGRNADAPTSIPAKTTLDPA